MVNSCTAVDRRRKSQINIITALCNQLVTTACGIIVPHILITAFGSEAYGLSVSITQFLSYITLLEGGIGGVARGKLYGSLARNDTAAISGTYYAIKRFFRYVAFAYIIYSIILGCTYYDLAHITAFSKPYVFALILVIGLSTLSKYMGGLSNLLLIVADQKQYVNNLILTTTTAVNTLVIVLLVKLNADFIWVKLGSSMIFIVRPLLYAIYVKKHYRLSKVDMKPDALEQKWTGIGQHIAYFLHTNTDIVLLTVLSDVKLVAVYAVYKLVISSIRSIAESFSSGMEAVFGELIAKNQLEKLRRSYMQYSTMLNSVSGVLFTCTGILIISFVRLYTKGITDANYIQPTFALILMMSEAVNCIMLPCSCLPIAANHLKQTRWGAYGEAIINIALSCILIKWSPLVGVALATLIATVFRATFNLVYSTKHILFLTPTRHIVSFFISSAVIASVSYAGYLLIENAVIENYIQWAICGMATFAIIALPIFTLYVRRSKNMKDADNGANLNC